MYKYLFISVSVILCIASCSHFKTSSSKLEFDSIIFQDSVIFNTKSKVHVNIFSLYATNGNQALKDSINAWIYQQLGDSSSMHTDRIPQILIAQGRKWLKEDSTEVKDIMADMGEPEWGINYDKDIKIVKIFENDDYVTLSNTTYTYCGGAHGGTYVECATFRKKDGHRMGWELLGEMPEDSLKLALDKGLKEYFEITSDVLNDDGTTTSTDQQLRNNLLEDTIAKPVSLPFITEEGIRVIYQQYEIACYAAGMPTFIIGQLQQ